MTEDEAKTKWCPFARVSYWSDGSQPTYNRSTGNPDDDAGNTIPPVTLCIGSACMAWRERPAQVREVRTDLGELPPGYHENEDSWQQLPRLPGHEGLRYLQTLSEATSYCGLVGQPQ